MAERSATRDVSARAMSTLEVIAAVIVIVMMLHVVVNALSRYLFNHPLEGTNEIVSYWYLPLVACIGFVAAEYRNEHIEARLVYDRFSQRLQYEVHLGGIAVMAGMCVALAYYTGTEAVHNAEIGLTGGVSGITTWPATFGIPLAYALLAVLLVVKGWRVFRRKSETTDESEAVDDLVTIA